MADAEHDSQFTVISEGKAKIKFPKGNKVFYNEAQVVNRDVSVAAIRVFQEILGKEIAVKAEKRRARNGISDESVAETSPKTSGVASNENPLPELAILEGLSASGLRSMRYALEIPALSRVVVNDFDASAVEAIKRNIEFNELSPEKVVASHADASALMFNSTNEFDVIDLDPYGSASMFIGPAVKSVKSGGLLCVTCTDMGVLCGKDPEACWARYGAMSFRSKFCHEMALRILLGCISRHAAVYKRHIVPVLSLSINFYVRVFVRVYDSALETKKACTKAGMVYSCVGCRSFATQRIGKSRPAGKSGNCFKFSAGTGPVVCQLCEHCGKTHQIAGPLWLDPIHDPEFARSVCAHVKTNAADYAASDRLIGMLTVAAEELPNAPLYYTVPELATILHATTPKFAAFRSAVINAGFPVSQSHCSPTALKTPAPPSVIWDIMRAWVREKPVKPAKKTSPAFAILNKDPQIEVDFTLVKGTDLSSKRTGIPKFIPNSENWGPKSRAKPDIRMTSSTVSKRKREIEDSESKTTFSENSESNSSSGTKRLKQE
eukprot:371468_1